MLPEATGRDLLYVSSLNKVVIYAYPSDKVVGKLTGFSYATGLCSDQSGNVWVTDSRESQISEYAHGGTKQIAVLGDEDEPVGCAVDPRSGDLAVANYTDNVYVYSHASGNPAIYTAPDFYNMQFCSYDESGNLFVDGWRARGENGFVVPGILKLSYGETQLRRFKLVGRRRTSLRSSGGLQWDGKRLVVGYGGKYHNELYRISDLGQVGKITKKITLTDGGFIPGDAPFILHTGTIVGRYNVNTTQYYIALWSYPAGGPPVKEFKVNAKFVPAGLAVSTPPK
jgi:DNA-binding beta-propeller fold protein YncE